jgi:hypothetical protein
MSRHTTPGWVALLLAAAISGWAPSAGATWGTWQRVAPPKPPDQSWLQDLPEKPGRGKAAVFEFRGDDVYQPVRAAVVRILRRHGLNVTVTLRRGDSAVEYREMSQHLNMAAFIDGEMTGEGARQSMKITLYSGVTGHRMTYLTFAGPTDKIVDDINHRFWTRVGPAITRARTAAAHPRRQEREPLRIDAGDEDS